MTDLELAEEIERHLTEYPAPCPVVGMFPERWQQIIAALRRAELAQTEIKGHMRVGDELREELRKLQSCAKCGLSPFYLCAEQDCQYRASVHELEIMESGTLDFMHVYMGKIGWEGIVGLAEAHPAGLVRGLCNLLLEKKRELELSQLSHDSIAELEKDAARLDAIQKRRLTINVSRAGDFFVHGDLCGDEALRHGDVRAAIDAALKSRA